MKHIKTYIDFNDYEEEPKEKNIIYFNKITELPEFLEVGMRVRCDFKIRGHNISNQFGHIRFIDNDRILIEFVSDSMKLHNGLKRSKLCKCEHCCWVFGVKNAHHVLTYNLVLRTF